MWKPIPTRTKAIKRNPRTQAQVFSKPAASSSALICFLSFFEETDVFKIHIAGTNGCKTLQKDKRIDIGIAFSPYVWQDRRKIKIAEDIEAVIAACAVSTDRHAYALVDKALDISDTGRKLEV